MDLRRRTRPRRPVPDDAERAAAALAQCPPFGADLARAGFVVLAPDLRGFGERWDRWPEGHRMCDHELAQQVAHGRLPLTGNLRDLAAGLDLLATLDRVDPTRVGAAGFSLGGTLTMLLAALDDRVRASVVSGAFSDPRAAARLPFDICGSQVFPGMLADVDHVQLAAAIAPRALLVETGDHDVIWDAGAAAIAAERAARHFASIGAADQFVVHRFDGDHRWDGARCGEFLIGALGGTTG